jgi:hypothetical protein
MTKLKVVLGVAASIVSVAALTIVVPGRGEAQIGSTPVRVVNTPLPVSGSVNAAVTGDVTVLPGDQQHDLIQRACSERWPVVCPAAVRHRLRG